VSRFTTLVRQDHLYEQEEARAKAVADESEQVVEREFTELMRSILARYHEEQIWSDKIRSASTYGSLAVLGLNLLVFVMAILVVEPWKRRRLTQTFEKKVEELSLENAAVVDKSMKDIGRQLEELSGVMGVLLRQVNVKLDGRPDVKTGTVEPVVATKERAEDTRDRELGVVAVSGVVAGVIGWLARGWLGS
jgi:sensitive to high expression protein 9